MALVEMAPLTSQEKGFAIRLPRLPRLPPGPVRIVHPMTPLPTRNLPQTRALTRTRALIHAVHRPPLVTIPLLFHLLPKTDS